jgi:predicted transposase YbfD/YdcC
VEIGTLKAVSVRGFSFPHTAQVLQVTRKVRDLRGRRWRTTIVYAVTSLTHEAASPARLADLLRGHWSLENGLHHVRDVTFAEDASQVHTGTAPQVMACLRNVAVGILRLRGDGNIAAALRHNARDATRPWSCSASQTVNQTHPALAGALDGPLRGRSVRRPSPSTRRPRPPSRLVDVSGLLGLLVEDVDDVAGRVGKRCRPSVRQVDDLADPPDVRMPLGEGDDVVDLEKRPRGPPLVAVWPSVQHELHRRARQLERDGGLALTPRLIQPELIAVERECRGEILHRLVDECQLHARNIT